MTPVRCKNGTFYDGTAARNSNNTFTAIAQDSYNRKDTNAVTVNLPAAVNFQYDAKGNLTSDGKRGLDYDDENQLIRITVTNSWKTEFTYDGLFRRRIRKEYVWSGSWFLASETRYVYDGRVVLQERDGNNLPSVTYTRGLDLSGTLQGAGGIGGLLARTDHGQLTTGNGQPHGFYHADGIGNVTALLNGQQNFLARYVYDPFGNILSKSGPLADANNYRFSSQEYHQNSGLLLYLYRAYDPNLQRFVNRDPIEEGGGINMYSFVGNDPVDELDPEGLAYGNPAPNNIIFDLNTGKQCFVQYHYPTFDPTPQAAMIVEIASMAIPGPGQEVALAKLGAICIKALTRTAKAAKRAKEIQKIQKAKDALQNLKEIEDAQRKIRQGKNTGKIIESTEGSRQRAKKLLKDIADDPGLADGLD